MYQHQLRGLAAWGKFLGWVSFIGGILYAIGGLFAFVVGAIPGIIMTIMGWKLIKASENAERLSYNTDDTDALQQMLGNYLTYFKIQGILMIITFALFIISIIITIAVGASLPYYRY